MSDFDNYNFGEIESNINNWLDFQRNEIEKVENVRDQISDLVSNLNTFIDEYDICSSDEKENLLNDIQSTQEELYSLKSELDYLEPPI